MDSDVGLDTDELVLFPGRSPLRGKYLSSGRVVQIQIDYSKKIKKPSSIDKGRRNEHQKLDYEQSYLIYKCRKCGTYFIREWEREIPISFRQAKPQNAVLSLCNACPMRTAPLTESELPGPSSVLEDDEIFRMCLEIEEI